MSTFAAQKDQLVFALSTGTRGEEGVVTDVLIFSEMAILRVTVSQNRAVAGFYTGMIRGHCRNASLYVHRVPPKAIS